MMKHCGQYSISKTQLFCEIIRYCFILAFSALLPLLAFSEPSVQLGSEFKVNTYTTGFQTEPSVAIDETGSFLVVWHSAGIFGQRYNSRWSCQVSDC